MDNATPKKITIKGSAYEGAKVAVDGVQVGTIRGWRQFTAKWGATGPGYTLTDMEGNVIDSDSYYKVICRRARYWAASKTSVCNPV